MAGPSSANRGKGWLAAGVAALAIAGLYLFIASRSTLWDRDEARFSRAAVEMVQSGNYLFPTFEGKLRPDKPILVYWFMAAGIKLLGPTELGVRFFSALATAGACLCTFGISRRLLGNRAGLWAMGILATTVMLTMDGAAAIADPLLLLCITAATWVMLSAMLDGLKFVHVPLLGLALGGGLLTKGPPGLIPVLSALGMAWMLRRTGPPSRRFWMGLGAATALALLIFLVWATPANNATGGEFLKQGIGKHVLGRAATPMEGHGGGTLVAYLLTLPLYLAVIFGFFFPWTLLLPGALAALCGGRLSGVRGNVTGNQLRAILLGWIIPTLAVMSLVATKLPHYVTPIWPAFALAVAALIETDHSLLTPRDCFWVRSGIWFFGVPAALIAGGLLVAPWLPAMPDMAPWFTPLPALRLPGLATGLILAATTLLAIHLVLREHLRYAAAAVLVGAVLFQLAGAGLLIPAIEPHIKLSPPLAQAIGQHAGPNVPVYEVDYQEPSLTFYLGHSPAGRLDFDPKTQDSPAVVAWARGMKPGVLVISRGLLQSIEQRHGPLGLAEIASVPGLNPSNGRPMDLLALTRRP